MALFDVQRANQPVSMSLIPVRYGGGPNPEPAGRLAPAPDPAAQTRNFRLGARFMGVNWIEVNVT